MPRPSVASISISGISYRKNVHSIGSMVSIQAKTVLRFLTRRKSLPYTSSEKRSALATSWGSNHFHLLLRSRPDDMFSVEQLSSTVSEAGTNVTSDKRLRQSFYNRVDYETNRIADELEIRRGKQFPYQCFGLLLLMTTPATSG